MSKIFITSDLHLGHAKLAEIRGFRNVKDHDECIIQNIADVIKNKRYVLWLLGDIAFGSRNIAQLNQIDCIKKIVLGNHDTYATELYLDVANRVYGAFAFKNKYLLTHIPVDISQSNRFLCNFHGHTHSRILESNWYQNVCLEQNNLKPFEISQLIDNIKSK